MTVFLNSFISLGFLYSGQPKLQSGCQASLLVPSSNSQKLQEVKRGDRVTHSGAIERNMARKLRAHKGNKQCNMKLCQFPHLCESMRNFCLKSLGAEVELSGTAHALCVRGQHTQKQKLYLTSKFAVCITQHNKNDGYQDIHCEKFQKCI